jgi:hypothetical protein
MLLGLSVLLAGCTRNAFFIDAAWFECRRDRDCAIIDDTTCTLVPINKAYARSFVDWMRRNHPERVSDEPCRPSAIRYLPMCDAARCSSKLAEPAAALQPSPL